MEKMNDGYYKNRHSCFLLQYHMVLITKYRHPVITDAVEETLKTYLLQYFTGHGLNVLAIEMMPDHVHILFEAMPNLNLSVLANNVKTSSSKVVRNRHQEEMKAYYRKPYFWSMNYFVGSVSERSADVVKRYIENQKGD